MLGCYIQVLLCYLLEIVHSQKIMLNLIIKIPVTAITGVIQIAKVPSYNIYMPTLTFSSQYLITIYMCMYGDVVIRL